MKRNSVQSSRNNGHYYNLDLLDWCRETAELTVHGVAVKLGMNRDTARQVFKGKASYKHVWKVAQFFNLSWRDLHDLDLVEFDRAVLNGYSRSVRSSGPSPVGGRRPAPLNAPTYTRARR